MTERGDEPNAPKQRKIEDRSQPMKFQKGKPRTGGRRAGTPNALTGAFRDAVRHVYTGLGGHANFLVWAKANETEFYRIASRLIPGEMQEDNGGNHLTIIVQRHPEGPTVLPAIEDQNRGKGEPS